MKIMHSFFNFLSFAILIGFTVFTLCFVRSALSGITWDEAITYDLYCKDNPILCFNQLITKDMIFTNNHFLNTLLISSVTFLTNIKYNELLIRLPNLIFYILYLVVAYKLSNKYSHKYLFFLLLVLNFGLFEYFGLARGYGIACSLVLLGLYYLMEFQDKNDYRLLILTYYIFVLACYAHTICLIGLASIMIYSQLYILIKKGFKNNFVFIKTNIVKLIPFLFALIVIINYHFKVVSDESLFYGGTNFFDSIIIGFVRLFGLNYFPIQVGGAILLFISVFIYINRSELKYYGLHHLIIICMIILIALTTIFNQVWLTGRGLIPLFPILMISLFEVIDKSKIYNKTIEFCICLLISIAFIINYCRYPLTTRDWYDDYQIKELAYNQMYNNVKRKPSTINDSYAYIFYQKKLKNDYNYDWFENE